MLLGAELSFAMSTALSVLIIACPCALGLAVPMSLVNAVGTAARLGLVIRNGDALMRAKALTIVLFDKTGTVTEGNLWDLTPQGRANTAWASDTLNY